MRFIYPERNDIFHPFRLEKDREEGWTGVDELDFAIQYKQPFGFASEHMYAVSAWVCLTRIFLLAFERHKEKQQSPSRQLEWQNESIYFHDMLSRIDGNINKEDIKQEHDPETHEDSWERVVHCDACTFINALKELVHHGVVEGIDRELMAAKQGGRAGIDALVNFDFLSVFSIPFDETNPTAAAVLKPMAWVFLKDVVRDAYERISWLQAVKDTKPKKGKNAKRLTNKKGARSIYTEAEKEGILQSWQLAQQRGISVDTFLKQEAAKQEKPLIEVQRLFWAASQWSRRK